MAAVRTMVKAGPRRRTALATSETFLPASSKRRNRLTSPSSGPRIERDAVADGAAGDAEHEERGDRHW